MPNVPSTSYDEIRRRMLMYKSVYDLAAEIAQDVIKARGEAIDGQKELIEAYLGDEAVTELYKKILRVLCDPLK